jgi:hypothetical protein
VSAPRTGAELRALGITPEGVGEAFQRLAKKDPQGVGVKVPPGMTMGPTGRITPREVLDLQGNLAEYLEPQEDDRPSDLGRYLDALASAEMGGAGVGAAGQQADVTVSRLIFEHTLTSRAIRIGANMNPEILLRAGDVGLLGRTARFGEDVAPVRHRGFAVFEETLWVPEIRSRRQAVHAISWGFLQFASTDGGYGRGWLVTFWGDVTRDIDEVVDKNVMKEYGVDSYVRSFGRWSPITCFPIAKGSMVGGEYSHLSPERLADIERLGQTPDFETFRPERLTAAVWQLMGETIEVTESTTVAQVPTTRKIGRGRDTVRPEVTVCTLRRPSRPTINPGSGKKRETRSWVDGGYEQTFWTGPGRSIPVKRVIGGHWSVNDETLPIKNRPRVDDLRR